MADQLPVLVQQALSAPYVTDPTTGRPPANGVNVGVHIYDVTLNKPVWSDGTNWRDATGTIA